MQRRLQQQFSVEVHADGEFEKDELLPGLNVDLFESDLKKAHAVTETKAKRKLAEVVDPATVVPSGDSGGVEKLQGSGGDPVVETRGEKQIAWSPPSTWLFWARIVPMFLAMTVVAMAFAGFAVEYWLHDVGISNGGYVPNPGEKTEWVSFIEINPQSMSKLLGGPKICWPLCCAVTIFLCSYLGYFMISILGGHRSGLIAGCMTGYFDKFNFKIIY